MIDAKKLEEIRYVLEKAETKIAKKSEKILIEMYWEIGNCLKQEDYEKIVEMKNMLAEMFEVEEGLFERSYIFYQQNSIKKRAMRWKK